MIKRYSIIVFTLAFLAACGTSEPAGPDEQIYGEWSDEIVSYTFLEDLTFEKINLIDNPLDTANLVRTFGNFYSDKENRVLSFTIRGFELDNGVILDTSTVGPTWVYNISAGDTGAIMSYQSNTSIGTLVKID